MEARPLTFDQVPDFLYQLGQKVDDLTALLQAQQQAKPSDQDRWFSIEELCEYLPGKPAITTVYGKVQRREIPFSRQGKKLSFLKSEIDAWLKSARVKTTLELASVADQHPTRQRRGGRKVA